MVPGINPLHLRKRVKRILRLGTATQRDAARSLPAFDALLLSETEAVHKYSEPAGANNGGRAVGTAAHKAPAAGTRSRVSDRSHYGSRRNGGRSNRPSARAGRTGGHPPMSNTYNAAGKPPRRAPGAARAGDSKGRALYAALSTPDRA